MNQASAKFEQFVNIQKEEEEVEEGMPVEIDIEEYESD